MVVMVCLWAVVVCLNEYSKVFSSKKSCVLDGASEDIDVGNGGNDELLSRVVAVVTVIVSDWLRITKWLLAQDCPKSGPGPGGPGSRLDQTPNVWVQVHPMPGLDPRRRSGSSW